MKKILFLFVVAVSVLGSPYQEASAQSYDSYTVKPGDSLWDIAVKYQVGLDEIIAANPQFENPDLIYPGDIVKVPLKDQQEASLEQEILALVNAERAKQNLSALTINWELSRVAKLKCEDMRDNNYFSHDSPTYGSPFDMINQFGISYTTAGENIAAGQATAEAVMESWMNSEGHRENILSSEYSELGVGYAEGGTQRTYWVQQFIGK